MIAIVTAALAALVSLAVGLPWALALRRTKDDVVDLVTDAVLVGIVLTVSGLTLYSWLGWAGLILSVLVELAVVAAMLRRRRTLAWPGRPVRREVVWIVVLVIVLAVALVLRRHTIDYITYTGDMGAYVNWANQFLRTGGLHASWPPFFPMFLVFGGLLTGAKGVTAVVAVTGLLLILGLVRILRILGVNPWVALVAGGVVAVHPESIWFSQIPLSESLNAPLIVLWLLSVAAMLTSEKTGRWAWAFVGGVTILALSLLRGTAPILVFPLVLIAIIALVAPRWRHLSPRLWLLVATNGAGSAIGFWYGVERIPVYYVGIQIQQLLPAGLFAKLLDVGVLKVGVVSAVTAILVIVVLAAVYLVVRRFTAAPDADAGEAVAAPSSATEPVSVPLTVGIGVRVIEVVGAGLLLVAVVDSNLRGSEVWNTLHREAFLLVIVAILAPVVLAVTRHGRVEASITIMASLIAALFVQLQTGRLQGTKTHAVFLYWDRYLYSEFFPIMMILVGILLGVAYRVLRVRLDPASFAFARRRPGASQVALTGLAIAVIAYVLVKAVLPVSAYIQQNTLLLGAGTIETKLQYDMKDVDRPFLWGGSTASGVPASGFPNTWMTFATPLAVSYGREYANSQSAAPQGDFSPDPVLTQEDVETAMACTNTSSVYVVENETTGPSFQTRLAGSDLDITRISTIRQNVTQLGQFSVPDTWHVVPYRLRVYEVKASAVPAASGTCATIPGP